MSLATRCTHCGTIFKVVQDQLKVSEGWVRCGRCHEVFNALPALFDLERDPPPQRTTPAAPRPPAAAGAYGAPAVQADAPPTPPRSLLNPQAAAPAPFQRPPAPARPAAQPEPEHEHEAEPNSAPEAAPDLAPEPASDPARFDPPAEAAPTSPSPDFELDTTPASPPAPEPTPVTAQPPPSPAPSSEATFSPSFTAAFSTPAAAPPERPTHLVEPRFEDSLARYGAPTQPMDAPPPFRPSELPVTDESDALDSRYLMPSTDERRPSRRRRGRGPDFADAEFPNDAVFGADEWASDFGPASAPMPEPAAAPDDDTHAATAARHFEAPPDVRVALRKSAEQEQQESPNAPAADFVREQAQLPPSQKRDKQRRSSSSKSSRQDKADKAPRFVRRAERMALWRRPLVRAVLGLTGLVLALALALQITHHYRDLLAAQQPALRPYLQRWCEWAQCRLQPPLRIEKLQVDSATLMRTSSEGTDTYRLTVVVNNRDSIALAWPHVDLALTDATGAVVARRSFSPVDAQWLDQEAGGAPPAPNAQGLPLPEAVPPHGNSIIQWRLRAPDLQLAGYTAELFYP